MNHHRDECGPKEPDFGLYARYPITSASMRRKHRRDLTGVSAFRIIRPRFQRLGQVHHRRLTYRFLAGQALVLAAFWALGHPWLYLLLWVLPWATLYQGLNRIRAIAEPGGLRSLAKVAALFYFNNRFSLFHFHVFLNNITL